MKNRIVAVALAAFVLLMPVATFASDPFNLGYGAEVTSYIIEAASCIPADGVSIYDTKVSIAPGKSAVYGFYVPFNTRSLTIKYTGNPGTTVIDTGRQTYTLNLDDSGEYKLEFAANLGIEPQNYYYMGQYTHVIREYVETSGEREFKITSTGGISIDSLVLERELIPISEGRDYPVPEVSDEVLKTASSVLLDINSPIIVVRGGRRYIDNNQPDLLPLNNNGTLYLPVNTLAKAIGYYVEDIKEKQYVLLRDDVHEYINIAGKATLRTSAGNPISADSNAIIYQDGITWAAVRYFAELAGKTVGYKDGLIAIDNKYTVNDILQSGALNTYALNLFKAFKSEKTSGNTYYVAQSAVANDENIGSKIAPFKTLEKAASVAQAGDTVIIREGVYREVLKPQNSGTAVNPITFRAADGEKVVISAAEPLGNFAHYKDNIYVASMGWDLGNGRNQLFIGEESMMEARYPNSPDWKNSGLSDLWPTRGDFYVPIGDNSVVKSDTLLNQDEPDYWKGGTYVGLFGYGYAFAPAEIASSQKGSMTVKNGATKWWWDHKDTDTLNYGCIIGHMNCLDIGKEWVKKGDMVYFIFPDGMDPNTTKVEAKARQLVIDIADKKFINIEGITTIGGGARMNDSEMCMLNGVNMKYISHYTHVSDQRDGYIDQPYNIKNTNGAPQRGEVGIYVGGTDNIIVNSHIDHSAAAGIYGVGLYTYIENNILNDCGYMSSYVSGINFNTASTQTRDEARGGYAVYNNTVYNCGRSCINVGMVEGAGHTSAPYLPMEIAYNDFHDGILASLDTGLVYEYFINRNVDGQKSSVHHNYIYTTVDKQEENPHSFGIYHDNGSYGSETYNNLVFNTGEKVVYTAYPIVQQMNQASPAYNDVFNNRVLEPVTGGVEALKAEDFPQEQFFYAGAYLGKDAYLNNYNMAVNGETSLKYSASDAILSEGIVLDNGIARFNANGQYICFPNVDFGDGADMINLSVYGDKYYSNDVIEVIVGDSIENGQQKNATVQISALDENSPDNIDVNVGYLTGKQNVYIRMKDYRSLGIGGVSMTGISQAGVADSIYSAKIYGGSFTDYDFSGVVGQDGFVPESIKSYVEDPLNAIVKNTWEGCSIEYGKVLFTNDSDMFAIAMGSGGAYTGQLVEVYLDSMEGEPIVEYRLEKTSWTDYSPVYIKLNEAIPAGVHTIYMNFPKESVGDSQKTSNIYYFAFLPVGNPIPDENTADEVVVKVLGGNFDDDASVQDSIMKFAARYVDRTNVKKSNGLTNTKSGTTAVYKGVNIGKTVSGFKVRYSSEAGYDGQTVEIRVGSASSTPVATFVTKGDGWENLKTEIVQLSTPLQPGEYDIYISFKGTKDSDQTCKLDWFGFSE